MTGRTAPAPVTAVLADGSAVLAPAELLTVLDALADAAALRQDRARVACLDCAGQAELCAPHGDDQDQADAYRETAVRLGDYR